MIIISILSTLWSIRLLLNLLSYIQLWYVKEYRFDRMLVHLKTKQGKRLLFLPLKRPPLKPKTCFIFTGSVLVLLGMYFVFPVFIFWKLFIMDILLFPITALFVVVVTIPTFVYHGILIRKAVRKLRLHKKMIIIGITGSYGKTTTKEILATILSTKFKTLKTEASRNSPIGIAEVVISKLVPDHEVFIVEMGAYKRGEIAQMSKMVEPEIGIVTAINQQHQDLFGSIDETIEAKYELIHGLTGKRIAIFNADNIYTKQMADRARMEGCSVVLFSIHDIAGIIHTSDSGISFALKDQHKSVQIHTKLIGIHQVNNILAAIKAALSTGMTLPEISKACLLLQPVAHTMMPLRGVNGSLFIDDTFNNNPDAARAAVDYLATTKGKKILVFQPMIELGSFAPRLHRELGVYATSVCDEVILTNDSYREDLATGIVMSPAAAASHIRSTIKKGDTVLFKGKEAARVLNYLL
jgi:UDP-N-acetylmuramoyl-tripeptide--D-alanyl-D-alanine ligase